jgi:hypothetical protein
MKNSEMTGRAKGGLARAAALSSEERREIGRKGAIARWGERPKKATHKGSFKNDFGIDVDCYVLDDDQKTAVISKGGMNEVLGFGRGASAGQFIRFIRGTKIASHVGAELTRKLENPIVFQGLSAGPNLPPPPIVHGYDVTILIDICKAIIAAESEGKLLARQVNIAKQAHVVIGASAKAGIKGLAYALAGYNPTAQEVIEAFKLYVQEEAKKYEPEFPNELYMEWHRLYKIPVHDRGKPWHFKYLTVNHIYAPIANSNGKILELIRIMKAKAGDRQKKLFQFLNKIGARALRIQLGRVLEMAESSKTQDEYEAKIVERFGGQRSFEFVIVPKPSSASPQLSEQSPIDAPVS